jgi:hypothetical protein
MHKTRAIIIGAVGLLTITGAILYTTQFGLFDPVPDPNSPIAQRASKVNAELRLRMSRSSVERLFNADVGSYPGDLTETSGWHCTGCGDYWSNELDLDAFDPRPHFWDDHGISWTVRTRFDRNDELVQHEVRPIGCCYRDI